MSRKKKSTSKVLRAAPPVLTDNPAPLWLVGLIVLVTVLAYSNSFGGDFIYDDDQAVLKNTSIHHLWPLSDVLVPPFFLTVGGRPLLNLSFAINYAINGTDATWSYHVLNFLVHILAGLTLLGVLRRTFLQPPLRERFGPDALPLAVAIAILWILDPLQTESVSYISQRAEALMGLFYLLTIYCFIRSSEPQTVNPGRWTLLAIVCCSAGAAFKEVMISAPIMVLLYDRTFVAGTFRRALRRHGSLYAGLALSWLVIAYGMQDIEGKHGMQGRIVGYNYGVTGWEYAMTECPALIHYMALMVWPHPLIIDYGVTMYNNLDEVLPYAVIVVALLITTGIALVRWPLFGFLGAWFFLILAPTSSFFPIVVSPIGEHRLYLPLLTSLVPLVLFLHYFLGSRFWFWLPVIALAAVWGVLTFLRNEDYATDVNLWKITVAQEPNNARAHNNYGVTLLRANRPVEASAQFEQATIIQPSYPDAYYNWGNAEATLGHFQAAIAHYQVALQQKPSLGSAQNNWGNLLDDMGHHTEALQHYLLALQTNPNEPQFHYNLGHAYLMMSKLPEAIDQFQQALQLNPNFADAHNTLGIAFFQMGMKDKAIEEFQEALSLNPNLKAARDNLDKIDGPGH